jgi:hypothetical protein
VIAEAEVDAAAGAEPDAIEDAEVAEDVAAIEATADASGDNGAVATADDSAAEEAPAEKAPAKAKRASKKS